MLTRSSPGCRIVRPGPVQNEVTGTVRLAAGPATLIVNHPEYPEGRPGAVLSDATRAVLTEDLTNG